MWSAEIKHKSIRRFKPMAKANGNSDSESKPRFDWSSVVMLVVIMVSLTLIFLVGLRIITNHAKFDSADIVAVLSPAIGAVGTVSAGVFGYSLGTRNTAEAQKTATAATEEATAVRQETMAIRNEATPLARQVERIATQAKEGAESVPGKRHLSEDDLNTLLSAAQSLAKRLG